MSHSLFDEIAAVARHRSTLKGIAVAGCLTTAQHIGLWDVQEHMPPVVRYTSGTTAIGLGLATAARYLTARELAIAFWFIATGAALAPVFGRLIRRAPGPDSLDLAIEGGDSHAVWRPGLRRHS